MSEKLYFAYGSNLLTKQMLERCPNHEVIGIAKLEGYRLCFPRISEKRHCAVASIEREVSFCVWGAVYRLTQEDEQELDKREGYVKSRSKENNPYNRIDINIEMNGAPTAAFTYIATPQNHNDLPSQDYIDQIRVGAREHNLPQPYQDYLLGLPCKKPT